MLPLEVLEQASAEMTDWGGGGMSVLEVSHRGKPFVACATDAEAAMRRVMGIPDDYAVLFLQGGATGQFAAAPMNLTAPGDTIVAINTGAWSKKAIAEAKAQELAVDVIADEAGTTYTTTPAADSLRVPSTAAYLHYTPNETIGGVEFSYTPDAGDIPLVADMSSTILSRPLDVSRFGVIYAGAQKNMGPAGLVVVVVRKDLLDRARATTPSVLNWTKMAESDSMLNTPPTFGIYLLGLILAWIERNGGLTAMGERNKAKADALYAAIDNSPFYANPVAVDARSWMNVPFTLANPDLDSDFLASAQAVGLTNLKGHRSVGGMRASIYNAMPRKGVETLVEFMSEYERTNA